MKMRACSMAMRCENRFEGLKGPEGPEGPKEAERDENRCFSIHFPIDKGLKVCPARIGA